MESSDLDSYINLESIIYWIKEQVSLDNCENPNSYAFKLWERTTKL